MEMNSSVMEAERNEKEDLYARMYFLFYLIYFALYMQVVNANKDIVLTEPVATLYGNVVGRRIIPDGAHPVNAFQGIPFAKPPLGELRFKKPQPPNPWNGTLETTKFAAKPIADDFRSHEHGVPVSEDCLYLNVFSPAWLHNDTLFPVIVFIHGGAFSFDSAVTYGDIAIAKHFVAANELIVVTLEYRLGFLGFFATDNQGSDDNVGLWDMAMGLEWVRDNIRHFGGDPKSVTLVGQSAGGAAADLLSLSPKTRELFHRVIPMSGNANTNWALKPGAVEASRDFAAGLGIRETNNSTKTIDQLRKLHSSKFIAPRDGVIVVNRSDATLPIAPHIDDNFLPDTVERMRRSAPQIPRIFGVVEHEGIIAGYANPTLENLKQNIASRISQSDFANYEELRRKALELYIQPHDYNVSDAVRLAAVKFYSDTFLGIAVQTAVLQHFAAGNNEVYLYSFNYLNPKSVGSRPPKLFAPPHCMDLNYLFEINMFEKYEFNEVDKRVLGILTKLWSNFAKYGNPNGSPDVSTSRPEGDFEWLPATKDHPSRYLSIGPNPTMGEHFQEGRPLFWVKLKNESLIGA